ncbi:dienelactone hydrolase family protein [Mesorhizobium sp. BR1-1-16]|uniref:alpha/beta hydrolase n=1 Tax=Mesorhizobium sp. BR1-1-16 TaxID=2876653 RepID=UPI001CCFA524|nr:dienelactone hydrolase family protein [Mesorhizobium sp. BR1-1-16]MBZ9938473.1 dienelactone hydrolase family protein [Mesorhizobium sp. BR1-1-16]
MSITSTRSAPPHGGRPILAAGVAPEEARGAVVMLHGRGGSADDILSLAAYFRQGDLAFLAPAAAGNVWYPQRFIEPRAVNAPYLGAALETVGNLVDDLNAAGLPDERIVLLGFSQGACLALEAAARRPARYGGVVALSGGLIGTETELWQGDKRLAGTPVLLGCSERDGHIPLSRVEVSAERFAASGASVTKRIYPGSSHGVNDDEIGLVRTMLTGLGAEA